MRVRKRTLSRPAAAVIALAVALGVTMAGQVLLPTRSDAADHPGHTPAGLERPLDATYRR